MTWKDYWVGCASSGASHTTRTHEENFNNQLPYTDHLVVIIVGIYGLLRAVANNISILREENT